MNKSNRDKVVFPDFCSTASLLFSFNSREDIKKWTNKIMNNITQNTFMYGFAIEDQRSEGKTPARPLFKPEIKSIVSDELDRLYGGFMPTFFVVNYREESFKIIEN